MKSTESTKRLFDLTLTGQLGLDFVNAIDWRTSEHPTELLATYADFIRWARHTGLVTEREGRALASEAKRRPQDAARVLARAIELRELLYRAFFAIARGKPVAGADLDGVNAELSAALARLRVARTADGLGWAWEGVKGALDAPLWPVVRAAAELLVSSDLVLLRECGGEGCGWLFLDTSRNKSRRWCSMEVCGNRAKARRFYEQTRAKG